MQFVGAWSRVADAKIPFVVKVKRSTMVLLANKTTQNEDCRLGKIDLFWPNRDHLLIVCHFAFYSASKFCWQIKQQETKIMD